jgi:hypothetical protein
MRGWLILLLSQPKLLRSWLQSWMWSLLVRSMMLLPLSLLNQPWMMLLMLMLLAVRRRSRLRRRGSRGGGYDGGEIADAVATVIVIPLNDDEHPDPTVVAKLLSPSSPSLQ